ncbi:hypothetical protein BHE74_00030826 [Ensete ventricosum]|nr:hypothetical protein GW17_00054199 [Ensete ventricosum]RWW62070.1 hypothetical protein BHE74_00030826 [Ensete ventricosum]RZS15434.1 hypothetical protein BHM03_00047277 [Ensete ventricosum]
MAVPHLHRRLGLKRKTKVCVSNHRHQRASELSRCRSRISTLDFDPTVGGGGICVLCRLRVKDVTYHGNRSIGNLNEKKRFGLEVEDAA